jgi:hypothetical protein
MSGRHATCYTIYVASADKMWRDWSLERRPLWVGSTGRWLW